MERIRETHSGDVIGIYQVEVFQLVTNGSNNGGFSLGNAKWQ